jgi:crotonobetainyl-CoA:carnitine CoA-transferase CaiB-like acyl-CoA transferase
MAGPLEGLLVVEASRVQGGAIAAVLLADHGADVVKLEPPGGDLTAKDLTRKGWDRGKRSIELDITTAEGLAKLAPLLERADVFLHSLEPAEQKRLGLDIASLQERHPHLVVCALTAHSEGTPFAGRPYGESLAAAALGAMVDKGSSFRPGPMYLGHPALHYGQSFLASIGVLAAIKARRETGRGQLVEASLLDAMLAQSPMNNWWQEDGMSYIKKGDSGAPDRFGRVRLVGGMFECGDGKYLQAHTGGAGAFKALMDILGFGERIKAVKGPEMAFPLDDDEYKAARVDIIEAFKAKPREEWIRLFQAADVAALPVLEPAQVLLDEQVEFVGQRIEMEDPDFGVIHQAAPAVILRNAPPAKPKPAPAVGAHNQELEALLKAAPRQRLQASGRPIRHALEGLRILDFSSFFACGYAGRLMSDLGAEVIKVETPEGDQMRPLPDVFDASQRGKRDIVLNLKSPEGLEAARRLVATADVVMHNLRPGKADKLGIGYEALSAINPKLIYAYLPGYGSRGPKSLLKSFAPLVSGWVGLLYEGGGEGNPPTRSVLGNEDYNNGFLGAVAVLMAVENRYRTGKGDYVECPQLHSSLFTTSEHFLDADRQVVYGLRMDGGQTGFNALDCIYRTSDGWIGVSCRDDQRFAALAEGIGREDLLGDARFRSDRDRLANDRALREILAAHFSSLTSAEAFARLDRAGAPSEIVCETSWVQEALWQDWAMQTDRVFEEKDSMYGHIREFGLFTRLSATPGVRKGPAPRLGHHTREILAEIGYAPAEIEELIGRKIAIQAERVTGRIDQQRVSAA